MNALIASLIALTLLIANIGQAAPPAGKGMGNVKGGNTNLGGMPPGLQSKGMPKGLQQQNKIPTGWSKGQKRGWTNAKIEKDSNGKYYRFYNNKRYYLNDSELKNLNLPIAP